MPCCRLSGTGPPTGDEDEEEELDSVSFASASSSLSSAAGPLPWWLLMAALPCSCLARASAFCLAGGGLLTPGGRTRLWLGGSARDAFPCPLPRRRLLGALWRFRRKLLLETLFASGSLLALASAFLR